MEMVDRKLPRAVIAKTLQRTAAIDNRLNIVRNRQVLPDHRETELEAHHASCG
jgi:hypothetical protein